jgi:hypothetical protein
VTNVKLSRDYAGLGASKLPDGGGLSRLTNKHVSYAPPHGACHQIQLQYNGFSKVLCINQIIASCCLCQHVFPAASTEAVLIDIANPKIS